MRFVLSSDWHPDVVTSGIPRFQEIQQAVEHTVDFAIENEVDYYIFNGDLTDPDSGGATFQAVALSIRCAMKLRERKIPSIWLAGNHDVCEDGSGATTLSPLAALEDEFISVAERPRLINAIDNVAFLCLPFTAASHGMDLEAEVQRLWPPHENVRVVVLSHLSVPGVMTGEETTDMPRGREISYPFKATKTAYARFQGHYHRRQNFDPQDGGPLIIIPGSLARLTFGEEDYDPSFLQGIV